MDKKSRIKYLENKIKECRKAYYDNNGDAIVTDVEYDAMEDELRVLDPENDIFSEVGDSIDVKFPKAKHSIPMGSQSKCANPDEFRNWWRLLNTKDDILVTYKIDGASLALYYENGELVSGITRGDGIEGRLITPNVKKMIGVPLKINNKEKIAVRGECVLSVENWKKVDANALNPRNLGTGIMSREDGKGCDKLQFIAFDVSVENEKFSLEQDKLKLLQKLGFSVVPSKLCKTIEEAIAVYNYINSNRKDSAVKIGKDEIWIDGLVMKLNTVTNHARLGETSGRPKWSTALKFPSQGSETVIQDVELSVGHTGTITPTALVKTVEIGGTNVSRVTLNNWNYINAMDVAIGDTVKVVKGGDIIPKVIAVIKRANNRKVIEEPARCPVCGGKAGKDTNISGEEGIAIRCLNPDCPAKAIGKIKRMVKSLDILDIGDAIIEEMYKTKIVRTISDLFKIEKHKKEISELDVGNGVWGEKRTQTMIDEVNKKKTLTLPQLLGSLGINGLGKRRVEIMMKNANGELDEVSDWQSDKLIKMASQLGVPGLAKPIQSSIDELKDIINDLLTVITIEKPVVKKVVKGKLNGSSFVLTGAFSRNKAEIHADIEAAGGEIKSSVSKGLTYLVQADASSTSTKTQKAQKLGVKIISEEDLIKMI